MAFVSLSAVSNSTFCGTQLNPTCPLRPTGFAKTRSTYYMKVRGTIPENNSTDRRTFLSLVGVTVASTMFSNSKAASASPTVVKTEQEWRKMLSPLAYRVLRESGTERSFTSPLNDEKRNGTFVCAGCSNKLFASKAKFDSGTGWPSFYEPVSSGAITYKQSPKDIIFMMKEVRCSQCDGHLGHVFKDAPQTPTGNRFCINGVALSFVPS
mmetsp:Transcript_4950/g.9072  ORF Transcript_4950/g.9072 Transcript_4950/m.9072 type:complete len:210 (-) Transcript_4950:267-896(-)